MHSHIIKIEDDNVIEIPQNFIDELEWDENTHLMLLLDGNKIILKEKTDWTLDDLQNNLETILERINTTRKPHHLLYEGKTFIIAPYSKELEEILDN